MLSSKACLLAVLVVLAAPLRVQGTALYDYLVALAANEVSTCSRSFSCGTVTPLPACPCTFMCNQLPMMLFLALLGLKSCRESTPVPACDSSLSEPVDVLLHSSGPPVLCHSGLCRCFDCQLQWHLL